MNLVHADISEFSRKEKKAMLESFFALAIFQGFTYDDSSVNLDEDYIILDLDRKDFLFSEHFNKESKEVTYQILREYVTGLREVTRQSKIEKASLELGIDKTLFEEAIEEVAKKIVPEIIASIYPKLGVDNDA